MCARLYPHMSPLSTQSKAKEGKRREMAETIFIFYDQIPVQNVVESKNPKLNLVFKVVIKVYLQRNYDTLFNSLLD